MGSIFLLMNLWDMSNVSRADNWKDKAWAPVNCTIVTTGIAHRGTCYPGFFDPDYSECNGNG
eukprot:CAMPEP_0172909088 /NCGR_PEP_ID=MMETSP1075-20121228/182029_1 /TAXON_ID=2916 /ORGANISM="Ceratium fusus, Strain PA161109" /LENGTH=61 /DNA_ID=CAMNT_0013766967 /DNA_START=1 /DNA_END=182 /DNA_ORIENTATION=+